MTDLLENEIASWLLSLAGHDEEPEAIAPEDLPDVLEGIEQLEHGEVATPDQVAAAFARFDRQ